MKRISALALPTVLVALLGGACAPSPPPQVGTITVWTPSPEATSHPAGAFDGECSNDYFPTDEGSSWEYQAGGADGQSRISTIVAEGDDGFAVEISLTGGGGFVVEWSCSDGDLTQLTPTAMAYVPSGGSSTLTTNNHSGVTLPSDLDTQPSWQESAEWAAAADDTTFQGSYSADNTAVGLENVTVPFGSFEAMRVESNQEGTLNGEPVSPCQLTQWWAKDVGLVRQETTCLIGGQSMTEVVELLSYDSP